MLIKFRHNTFPALIRLISVRLTDQVSRWELTDHISLTLFCVPFFPILLLRSCSNPISLVPANFAKEDPGKARQRIEARAGTNFSQPRTSFLADLCTDCKQTKGILDPVPLLRKRHIWMPPNTWRPRDQTHKTIDDIESRCPFSVFHCHLRTL